MEQESTVLSITMDYFNYFKSKDIDSLRGVYNDDIILKDWTGEWIGVNDVVSAITEFFENDFHMIVENIDVCDNKAYSKLKIKTGNEITNLLYVITYDEDGLVESITAYKG